MSLLPNSNAIETGGYTIPRSLRFRATSSAYLNRTNVASPTNNSKWTLSFWIKRGSDIGSGTYRELFGAYNGNVSIYTYCYFDLTDHFYLSYSSSGAAVVSNNVFRDPTAWYHIVVQWDTTPNQIRAYVNGVEMSYAAQAPAGTYISSYNYASTSQTLMAQYNGAGDWTDGYLAEVNFIDGQALNPTYFGETSTTTGAWIPKKYTGTYGNNGSYLPFSDTTSATTLCYDKSGKGNNWTPHNISTTAGQTYDSVLDVPTLTSTTAANYCTLNPLNKHTSAVLRDGNLTQYTGTLGQYGGSTFVVSSGKWYYEYTCGGSTTNYPRVGFIQGTVDLTVTNAGDATSYFYARNGNFYTLGGGIAASWSSWTTNDVIGVGLDQDGGSMSFYKNGVLQGTITGTFGPLTPAYSIYGAAYFNFGQQPFIYNTAGSNRPAATYLSWNTNNMATPAIKQGNLYMDATLYTGNGGTKTVTNAAALRPDFVWAKTYSNVENHGNYDTSRLVGGVYKALYANLTNAEGTDNGVTAFNSNGFTLGGATVNVNGASYVGWQWKANGGTTSSNTSGSITSTVQANTTSGFSIVTYTGTGSAATIGHGLGVAPKMIIVKSRSRSDVGWCVYHINDSATPNNGYLLLNSTSAFTADSQVWNNTAPTSSVFSVGNLLGTNGSGATYVAYCWAEITGYSKFGIYAGNGSMSDGPFIYTGFRPRWILIKALSAGTYWELFDTARNTYNVVDALLKPNTSDAQLSSYPFLDVVANGFKIRSAYGYQNDSGVNYIYVAFAENPFNYSNAR